MYTSRCMRPTRRLSCVDDDGVAEGDLDAYSIILYYVCLQNPARLSGAQTEPRYIIYYMVIHQGIYRAIVVVVLLQAAVGIL